MRKKDIQEAQNKTVDELQKLLKEAKDMLLSLKLTHEQNKLKNTSSLSLKRKEIAVLKTFLRAKEEKK